jgi:hypothetical protein
MNKMFVRLIKLTNSREDFFTECIASAMRSDFVFAESFIRTIVGYKLTKIEKVKVETQKPFPEKKSILDMYIRVNDNFILGIENKLDANLGDAQLEKYLELPLNSLILITAKYNYPISKDVLNNPIYIKPKNRCFFMWHEFYDVVAESFKTSQNLITDALLSLFESFGFDPPPQNLENLYHLDNTLKKKNLQSFSKRYQPLIEALQNRGWRKIHSGSVVELYVENGKSKKINSVWIDPIWIRNNLRVRLTPNSEDQIDRMKEILDEHKNQIHLDMYIDIKEVRRINRKEKVIEIIVPMKKLFKGLSGNEINNKLKKYVVEIFDVIDSNPA